MATLDFQSDPQLIALTDALRAGPGSPQWRDAVSRLRALGGDEADEYLLLCTAREHLASGRSYREIHAGPGFSRKVMQAVEQDNGNARSRVAPTAGIIALISGLVVVVVLASAGWFIWRSRGATPAQQQQDLSQVYFTETLVDAPLDAMPQGWRQIGALPLRFEKGLRPGAAPAGEADSVGGALFWEQSVLPSRPMQIETTLRLPAPESDLAAQVFVTDDPSLSGVRATSPHELAWTYRQGAASVALPSGRLEPVPFKPGPKQQTVEVRIQFDAMSAAIDVAGQRVWSGPHGLDPNKPRFLGVRFLAPAGAAADPNASFRSIQLTRPR